MNKRRMLAVGLGAWLAIAAYAQKPTESDRKWDAIAESYLQHHQRATRGVANAESVKKGGFIISCEEASAVAEWIRQQGYEATEITGNIVTAKFPADFLYELSKLEKVKYIKGARRFRSTVASSRRVTGVDRIHRAEGLETPFTGKGVIVGVIDQGFEYLHPAFKDKNGKSRVLSVWDHFHEKGSTTIIPSTGDHIPDCYGHATHVTNIAAGSKVLGNDYYGMAPEADLIMIPSNFLEHNVLEEAAYIQKIAKKEGKPFVINMSFGSQVGPHDGSGIYCEVMDAISEKGGILVAAMGNEGDLRLHGYHKFTKPNEKIYIVSKPTPGPNSYCILDLWGMATDSVQHLKVTPFVYDNLTRKHTKKSDSFWNTCAYTEGCILDPMNKKENFYFEVNIDQMQLGRKNDYFGIEVEGNPGDEFHAWFNPEYGEYHQLFNAQYLKGDGRYCVGEGAATIPSAISVASFNGNDGKFVSLFDGKQYSFNNGPLQNREGTLSDFSSHGPFLGEDMKPTVAAPGHAVASARSKYSDFNISSRFLVSAVKEGTSKYYYDMKSGTSMAAPAVAGIVALWLEANPELTHKEVKEIIKATSEPKKNFDGTVVRWDEGWGYGKINAYDGLKMALEMAENTGINDRLNSETPVTLMHGQQQVRILFNNDETFANISVYSASGMLMQQEQLQQIRRGSETVVTTVGWPAGVYVVTVSTTSSTMSRKIVAK